jgi:hypothetical protein
MSVRVVIFVPAEGSDAQQFLWAARAVNDQVYKSRALIVKVKVDLPTEFDASLQFHRFPISFTTDGGHKFSLAKHQHLTTFITISHAGQADGPIFKDSRDRQYQPWAHMAPIVFDEQTQSYQVWGRTDSLLVPEPRFPATRYRFDALLPRAQKFWQLVGKSLEPKGKIILLGCNYGAKTYLDKVARASGRRTFGPDVSVAAADVKTAVTLVKHIERGVKDNDMRMATPLSAILRINDLSEIKNPYEPWDRPRGP